MRPIIGLLALLVVACQATPPPLSDADKTGIRALTDSFVAYFHRDNDSGAAALYTEHAVLMPPNRGSVEGRAAIRAFMGTFPAMPDFTVSVIEIEGRGDLAYVRGTYSFTMPAAGGQPAVPDHGKFLEVRRRQGDGRWLVSQDMFNSDLPLPAPPAPPPARR